MERCAWCGRAFDSAARRLRGRVRCGHCGVATTMPWPTDADLDAAYGGWYRPDAGRFSGPGDALLRLTRGALARRLDRIAPAGRIVDVGAGDGTLVRALARRGRDALGLERGAAAPGAGDVGRAAAPGTADTGRAAAPGAADAGRGAAPGAAGAARVVNAELADLEGPAAAGVFWHSLEHLRDPTAALRDAAERLAPGGVVVVAVPDNASTQARAFGARWLALDLPRHLTHTTGDALVAALEGAGLRVERRSATRGGQSAFGWLHGLTERATGVGLYDAIRAPEARERPLSARERRRTLVASAALAPAALVAAALEAATGTGGSVYVEARKLPPSATA